MTDLSTNSIKLKARMPGKIAQEKLLHEVNVNALYPVMIQPSF